MADVDINPFGEHKSRPEEPTGENIPLNPLGGSSWEPSREREMPSTVRGQRVELLKYYISDSYKMLSERLDKTLEAFHYDYFNLKDGELYYTGPPLTSEGKLKTPLTSEGKLKTTESIVDILGKKRFHALGFDIPRDSKITARQAVALNKIKEKLPSVDDIAKADAIEMEELGKNMEDVISQMTQTDDLFEHPLH